MFLWLVYAVVGRILIFVWQRFPSKYLYTEFIKEVHACDLCSGVYIYTALALGGGMGLVWSPVIGVVTSFIVWVFIRGLKTLVEPDTLIIK